MIRTYQTRNYSHLYNGVDMREDYDGNDFLSPFEKSIFLLVAALPAGWGFRCFSNRGHFPC